MRKRSDGFPARQLATALVLVCLAVIAAGATAPSLPRHSSEGATAGQVSGIVGDETCATCHDTEAKGLHNTLHGKAQNGKTPAAKAGQACETCHGPGQKHVDSGKKEDIVRFATLKARDANEACLSCHAKNATHAAGSYTPAPTQ